MAQCKQFASIHIDVPMQSVHTRFDGPICAQVIVLLHPTQVRARPLSDTNPEISKYMEAVAGPSAGVGGIVSLAGRGRGDVDADSMGYDEVRYPEETHGGTRRFFSPCSFNSSLGDPVELTRSN